MSAPRSAPPRAVRASAAALALLLTACTPGGDPAPTGPTTTTTAPGPEEPPPPTETATPGPSPSSGPERAAVGEAVTVPVPPGSSLELTVTGIEVLDECPDRVGGTREPESGHFVVVDLEASLTGDDDASAPLMSGAFGIADASGRLLEVTTTDASFACLPDDELAPPFVGAGESVSGAVVLDSAVAEGFVVYGAAEESWAWPF